MNFFINSLLNFSIALIILSFAFPAWSEAFEQLIEKEGIYYKKDSDTPFTGKINGLEEGSFLNGSRDGFWITYFKTRNPLQEATYKNGMLEGPFKTYQYNGQIRSKGVYKQGKKNGLWITYKNDGSVWELLSGTYENDSKLSDQ